MADACKQIPKLTSKWKPKNDLIECEAKQFIIHFDEILNNPSMSCFNKFYVNKISYINQLPLIVKYISYFVEYYDTDQELIVGYLKLKHDIDVNHKYNVDNMDELIHDIYEILLTPSIEKRIDELVEYNNTIDIENDVNGKKYKTSRKYVESLEFNNEHTRLMHKISFAMKIICPVMLHYFVVNKLKASGDNDYMYKFYEPLLGNRMSDTVNIYNKLYVYVKCKIQENRSQNSSMYEQRDIFGKDISTLAQEFLRKRIISENMFKYVFDKNLVALNKVIVEKQLVFFIKLTYNKTMTLVSTEQNGDGLSGMEKLEMNMSKLDEGMLILSDLNISSGMQDIINKYQFDISEEEIKFMMENYKPSGIQLELITMFFSKYFGESRNVKLTNKRQISILAITLKKLLLTMDANIDGRLNISYLPYIITGNIEGKFEETLVRNNKFMSKLIESPKYRNLIDQKYKALEEIKPDHILMIISSLCKTRFTYVTYEYPEKLGEVIDVNRNKLAYEIVDLLSLA